MRYRDDDDGLGPRLSPWNEELYFNQLLALLNSLYDDEDHKWKVVRGRKDYVDAFGHSIQEGEPHYFRVHGDHWSQGFRLTLEGADRLVSIVLWGAPYLRALGEARVHQENETNDLRIEQGGSIMRMMGAMGAAKDPYQTLLSIYRGEPLASNPYMAENLTHFGVMDVDAPMSPGKVIVRFLARKEADGSVSLFPNEKGTPGKRIARFDDVAYAMRYATVMGTHWWNYGKMNETLERLELPRLEKDGYIVPSLEDGIKSLRSTIERLEHHGRLLERLAVRVLDALESPDAFTRAKALKTNTKVWNDIQKRSPIRPTAK